MDQIYRAHAGVVFGYLLGLTHARDQAEDLMQETFVRATRALAGYRGGSPRAWLLAIARTTFLDAARKHSAIPVASLPEELSNDPDATERLTVRAALERLSEPHRTVLVLRDELGLPYDDIARCIGRSLGATKVLIHRARLAFRAAYDLEGGHA